MELENIKTQTTWSEAAESINSNNLKIITEVTKLQGSTYKNKGYFKTLSDLQAAFPTAAVGSKAYVGLSYPYAIYLWENNSWVDSGVTGGEESVKLDQFYTKDETDSQISALEKETGTKLTELSAEINPFREATFVYGGEAYKDIPLPYHLTKGMTLTDMGVASAVYLKKTDGENVNVYNNQIPYTIQDEIVSFSVNTAENGSIVVIGDVASQWEQMESAIQENANNLTQLSEEVATHFGAKLPYGGAAYTSFPCRLYPGMTIVSMGVSTAVYLKTKDGKTINVYNVPYTIEEEIVAFSVNTTSNGEVILEGDVDELKDKVSDIENNVSELEKQVSHPNIPYMEFGGNLFDYRDTQILSNHYIAGDGNIRDANGWSVSGYIAIETNKTYVFKCYPVLFGTGSVKNIPSYAADKTFLNTIVGTLKDNYLVILNTNKDAKYVRVTIDSNEIESFMFVEGDIYPSERKRYDWIPNKYFNQSPVNALYGKIALFDGDSIAAGTEDTVLCGWSKIVGDKNSMDWHSIAVSGGTITNGVYDNGSLKHPICLGVDTFYSQGIHDPDYIIFEGGSNDELLGDFRNPDNLPERFGVFNEADFTGPFDNSTFCGALDYLFFKAQSLYPKTKFGFIIAQKMGKSSVGYTAKTHNRRAIFDYIIRSCRKWGIPYIDLWEEGWLNPSISQHYDSNLDKSGNIAAGSLYTDGQHLTASGYQLISSKIEGWMKTL